MKPYMNVQGMESMDSAPFGGEKKEERKGKEGKRRGGGKNTIWLCLVYAVCSLLVMSGNIQRRLDSQCCLGLVVVCEPESSW